MILPVFYNVDITQPLLPVPLQPMLVTQDALANRIGVRLFEGKTPYSPGGSCAGFAVRRDGATVAITGAISGNEMYIDLPAAAYALEGPINIGIKNVNGGAETTVFLGMGTVLRGETDTAIDPGTIIPSVSALIAAIDAAVESIPADYSALLSSIAPAFSTSEDYAAGDYVWYSGTLYRFDAAHAAGSWTGTDAVAAVIGNDLTDLKSAVNNIDVVGERRVTSTVGFTRATINVDTGADQSSSARIRTDNYFTADRINKVVADTGYKVRTFEYQLDGTYVKYYDFSNSFDLHTNDQRKYRFVLALSNDATITVGESIHLVFYENTKAQYIERRDALSDFVENTYQVGLHNLLDRNFYQAGDGYGVEIATGVTSRSNSAAASDYIEIEPGELYSPSKSFNSTKYGAAYYDSSHTYISGQAMSNDYTILCPPAGAKYIRITMPKAEIDECGLYKASPLFPYPATGIQYYGNKVALDKSIKSRFVATVSKSTYGSSQGGSVYGDELFTFANNLETAWVLNLKTKKVRAISYTGSAVDNHANCVFFSNKFYDENDPYPLVYISSEREMFCGIYRLTVSGDAITFDEVSRINFNQNPNVESTNCYVDFEQEYIYVNYDMVLYQYKLPSSVSSDVTLAFAEYDATTAPTGYLKHVPFDVVFTQTARTDGERVYKQDGFIHNGLLFLGTGGRDSASINVIDLHVGQCVSFIDLSAQFDQEIETVALYNSTIIVLYNDGNLYQYAFGGDAGASGIVSGGSSGTTDYNDLTNKPSINNVALSGNKTTSDLGIHEIPSGGTSGQVLKKASGTDYDVSWANESGGGGSSEVSIITPSSGDTFTLDPFPVTYSFGEMATLTVTVTATTAYHFMFSCPSAAATTLTMNGITGTMGDTVAAGKTYEVDIWAGIALIKEIEVTPVT